MLVDSFQVGLVVDGEYPAEADQANLGCKGGGPSLVKKKNRERDDVGGKPEQRYRQHGPGDQGDLNRGNEVIVIVRAVLFEQVDAGDVAGRVLKTVDENVDENVDHVGQPGPENQWPGPCHVVLQKDKVANEKENVDDIRPVG